MLAVTRPVQRKGGHPASHLEGSAALGQPITRPLLHRLLRPIASRQLHIYPLPMPHSPARAHVNSSPPGISSLDSLRSIHERTQSIHTSAPQHAFSFPQFPSLKNSFSNDEPSDKENPNPMLSEEDRAENEEAEREHIRQKCTFSDKPCPWSCSRHCSHEYSDILTSNCTLFDRRGHQEPHRILSRPPWVRLG